MLQLDEAASLIWKEVLMPRMRQGIQGGFITPPQEAAFDVHNFVK
jgi:hypothetical protein